MFQIPQYTLSEVPIFVQAGYNDKTPVNGLTISSIPVYIRKPTLGLAPISSNGGKLYSDMGAGGLFVVQLDEEDTDTQGCIALLIDAAMGGSAICHDVFIQVVPNDRATDCEFLAGTAGVLKISGLPDSDAANHWVGTSVFLKAVYGSLKGQQHKITASATIWDRINGATYDDLGNAGGSYLLYAPGAFTNYTWASGDRARIRSGTNMTPGVHQIAAKVNDDAILFTASASIAGADNSAGDIIVESLTSLTVQGGFTSTPTASDRFIVIAE